MADGVSVSNLFRRWQDGDHEAGNELYCRLERALRAIAGRKLGDFPRLGNDSHDLAASAFGDLAAEKEQPDFQPDTHGVFRWLFNRIASKARREKNKNKRRRPLDSLAASGDGRHAAAEPPDSSPGPGQQSADNDWLANLLGRLKPREQEIVTLILQGYRKKEIAEQLGCDKTTLWRAMKKIAECAFGNDHRAH